MAHLQLDADTVKARVDIAALAQAKGFHLSKGDAKGPFIKCPFHGGGRENTASLHLLRAENAFKCFGCDASGDVIDFVQRLDGLSFPEAIAKLSYMAGVAPTNGHGRNGQVTTHRKQPAHEHRQFMQRDGWVVVAESYFGADIRQVRYEHRQRTDAKKGKPESTARWEHRDGERWCTGRGSAPLPLFRNGIFTQDYSGVVIGFEGPVKATAVEEIGLAGFDHRHLESEHCEAFAGLDVLLWPDADEAGEKFVAKAVDNLKAYARSIRIVQPLTELGAGADIVDALRLGWRHEQIMKRIDAAKPIAPQPAEQAKAQSSSAPLTEIGLAERFVQQHGADVRYSHATATWFLYDEKRWREDDTAEVERRAKATVRALYNEAAGEQDSDRRQAVARFAAKADSDVMIRRMLNRAAAEDGVPVRPTEFDADPTLLNCLNGVVNLRTGELLPHQRELMLTRIVPVVYDPHATSSAWSRFLGTVTKGNADVQEFLQTAAGYTATGLTTEEKLFFVFGPGVPVRLKIERKSQSHRFRAEEVLGARRGQEKASSMDLG